MTASNQTQHTPTPMDINATIVGPVVELRYASHGEAMQQLRILRERLNSHDALVEALTCAKNILYLLTPEVSALGMRSYLIHEKIAAALAKAGVTP